MSKTATVVIGLMLAAAGAAGGFWFGQKPKEDAAKGAGAQGGGDKGATAKGIAPITVEATSVVAIPLPQGITTVGSLRSDESIVVRPEVAGRIAEILFQEGQRAVKGTVLIRLDPAVNRAEVQQARANLALAQAKFNRSVELLQKGFVSAQARDEAENNLRVTEASVALAEARLAKTEIKAPFGGILGLRVISLGDYVKEGQDLVNLESIDPLKVDFRIPEIYLKDVQVGQTLQVSLDALPGKTFEGRVFAVNPLLDAGGRSFVIRAIVRNSDTSIRPGMFARVLLMTREVKDSLVLPETALVPQGDDQYVFRVVEGKAQRVKIGLGQRRDGKVEILNGLAVGDIVVTAGQPKIRDGSAVRVAPSDRPGAGKDTEAGGNGRGKGGPDGKGVGKGEARDKDGKAQALPINADVPDRPASPPKSTTSVPASSTRS